MNMLNFSKSTLGGLMLVTLVFTGCAENKDPNTKSKDAEKTENKGVHTPASLLAEITELETVVTDINTPNHTEKSLQLIQYYEDYANMFSNDKLAPEMLFRAGNQAVNLEKYELSIEEYSRVEKKYRYYLKRPEAIFLEAFVYETYLDEYGKAEEKYKKIIKQYPKHELASQAEESLKYIGMSDEERIKQFEKNL